jgi:hypothetical protein
VSGAVSSGGDGCLSVSGRDGVWLTGVVTDGPEGAGVAGVPAEEPADVAGGKERRTIARAEVRVLAAES